MSPVFHRARAEWVGRLVGGLLGAMLLLTLAAASWHPLHEWLHGDADEGEHDCAVTLVLHGQMDTGSDAVTVVVLAPLAWPAERESMVWPWVPSVYLATRILEHAPPRLG
jgi:hypothetical protein